MAGLWDALKQYIGDALPGGALNPETQPVAKHANYLSGILDPASQVSQDVQAWHKRTQNGLMDQLAGRDTPEAEQAYQTMMQAAGMAPVGMIAWHGSPHKFDKFSLDKIGTGEGAQAYGHGLYLAESPEVAANYRNPGGPRSGTIPLTVDGVPAASLLNSSSLQNVEKRAIDALSRNRSTDHAIGYLKQDVEYDPIAKQAIDWISANKPRIDDAPGSSLYKTDIPDEAVARFLDWDKPVPEDLRQMISKKAMEQFGSGSTGTSGEHLYKEIARELGNPAVRNASPDASAWLAANGIPGIRYLDGGSRGAGSGTSNYVVFDPEMIRILERNGQPTGLQQWKPGEWK